MENKRKIEIVEKIIELISQNPIWYPFGICQVLNEFNETNNLNSQFKISHYEYAIMFQFFTYSTGYYDCHGERTEKCDGAFRFKNNEKRLKYLHKKLKELKNER